MHKPLLTPVRKLVIVGVGLIGGSFALSLKKAGLVQQVVGVGRSLTNLHTAQQLGVIDTISQNLVEAVQDADFILLATPVGQLPIILQQLNTHISDNCIVSDVGSTKSDVIDYAQKHFHAHLSQFIPAHPIAGAEKSGAEAAKSDLYQDKKVVLTPLAENSSSAVQKVQALWEACGASVHSMLAEQHDRVFAAVSHLPHVLSFALVAELANRHDGNLFFEYAASGFRDFTRIAGSHPEMWRDICMANREAILNELAAYQTQLSRLQTLLETENSDELQQLFSQASHARQTWKQHQ